MRRALIIGGFVAVTLVFGWVLLVGLPRWYGPRDNPPLPLVISPHGSGIERDEDDYQRRNREKHERPQPEPNPAKNALSV